MTAWRSEGRPVDRIELIDADELGARLERADPPLVLDVREADEFAAGHIPDSVAHPLSASSPSRSANYPAIARSPRSARAASARASRPRSSSARASSACVHVGHGGVGTWERQGRPIREELAAGPRELGGRELLERRFYRTLL